MKLMMNNTPLAVVDDFVYLGITLNKNLSWKPHTQKIAAKISKINGVLSRLIGLNIQLLSSSIKTGSTDVLIGSSIHPLSLAVDEAITAPYQSGPISR
jgi:hypothetical protein